MTTLHKMILPAVLAIVVALLFGAQLAAAQEIFDTPNKDGRPAPFRILQPQQIKADVKAQVDANKDKRDDFRTRQIDVRTDLRADHIELQTAVKTDADAHRAELKVELDAATTPEERQAILQEARAERDAMRNAALAKRAEFRQRAEVARDTLKEHRAEFHSEIKTDAGKRAVTHLESILKRISNALDSFVSILERVHNKLAELEATGVDTTTAAAAAVTAETSIDAASTILADARVAFSLMIESDTPREHLEDVRVAARAAAEATKEAHRTLKEAVSELKELIRTINAEAEVDASAEVTL